ncbi:hypothetical protein ABZ372_28745, partial [Streptomyces sp. NPDC005921]
QLTKLRRDKIGFIFQASAPACARPCCGHWRRWPSSRRPDLTHRARGAKTPGRALLRWVIGRCAPVRVSIYTLYRCGPGHGR